MKTALLIIDMQVCNFEGSAPVYKGRNLLKNISSVIARARNTEISVIYIRHCGPEGAIDEPGTPGWEIHPVITPRQEDIVIQKYHPDAFQDTSLHHELKSAHIQRVIIAGIQTEYCIDTTCRRAYSLGYKVVLVKDGHSTWDTNHFTAPQVIAHHNQVLGGWFAELKEADKITFDD
ncbi:MAG: isochorismatase [Theionarchaea archaeon DG-70]|nr:MAG: isochorismatase [Theionarchaea archaeon DG-70]